MGKSTFDPNLEGLIEVMKFIGMGTMLSVGCGILYYSNVIVPRNFEREKQEKQEEQRACAVKQEAASFTGRSTADCSPPLLEITYKRFLRAAYYKKNDLVLDQEQAWLTRGDEIGKKIDSKKNFTRELCVYTRRIVSQQTFFMYALKDISFLERCELEYKVEGIHAVAEASAVLVREAKHCVAHDLPTIGDDICYKRAMDNLEQFVRPLAKRTGFTPLLWMTELDLEYASRPAK
ncbi:hypothetical protein HZC31_03760 [Candidatus Woesearchaeota archaeon]|nr:hypothetical protein [Candidatus Woesearchaeota archaeon]